MSTRNGTTSQHAGDAALLAELRQALTGPATDESVAEFAKAALTFRTMDEELSLIALESDSAVEAATNVGVRGGPRILVFRGSGVSVEVEEVDGELIGQVIPAEVTTVQAESSAGESTDAQTDDLGCFTIGLPSSGPVRLRLPGVSATLVTEWASFT
ncbi:MAG: hypothetical protein ACSLE3_08305 [Microbacteriaceae bacterium]